MVALSDKFKKQAAVIDSCSSLEIRKGSLRDAFHIIAASFMLTPIDDLIALVSNRFWILVGHFSQDGCSQLIAIAESFEELKIFVDLHCI